MYRIRIYQDNRILKVRDIENIDSLKSYLCGYFKENNNRIEKAIASVTFNKYYSDVTYKGNGIEVDKWY